MTVKQTRQAGAEIEVTPQMIEAGLCILARSGAVDELMEADTLLVTEIYQSMSLVRGDQDQSCPR